MSPKPRARNKRVLDHHHATTLKNLSLLFPRSVFLLPRAKAFGGRPFVFFVLFSFCSSFLCVPLEEEEDEDKRQRQRQTDFERMKRKAFVSLLVSSAYKNASSSVSSFVVSRKRTTTVSTLITTTFRQSFSTDDVNDDDAKKKHRTKTTTTQKGRRTKEEDATPLKLDDETNPLAGMMFPWERAVLSSPRRFDGESQPMPWWHKLYWAAFAVCVGLIASNKMRERHEHANETERRERELKRNRRAMARALEGRSFVGTREYDPRTERMTTTTTSTAIGRKKEEGGGEEEEEEEEEEDPFEGLEPHEIAALVAKEAPDGDVYAGWSPEEIQEYEEKRKKEREKEKKGVFVMPPNVAAKR